MAGLVRGACVTGGWSVEQAQRDAFFARIADNLDSAAFHYGKARGASSSRFVCYKQGRRADVARVGRG